jgi:hypothetical protein
MRSWSVVGKLYPWTWRNLTLFPEFVQGIITVAKAVPGPQAPAARASRPSLELDRRSLKLYQSGRPRQHRLRPGYAQQDGPKPEGVGPADMLLRHADNLWYTQFELHSQVVS